MPNAFSVVRVSFSPAKWLMVQLVVSGSVLLGTILLIASVCGLGAAD